MSFEEFRASLDRGRPPAGASGALQALWYDARGDWTQAHEGAQGTPGPEGAWVHAYLHRKEGDESNARYWYARAGRILPAGELAAEWESIVRDLLERP